MIKRREMIKLFSLNAGGRLIKIDSIIKFLTGFKADVICLQEIFESDFKIIKKSLQMVELFVVMTKKERGSLGIAILMGSNLFIKKGVDKFCYAGNDSILQNFIEGNMETVNWYFLYATVVDGKDEYVIGGTYFIWTSDGKANKIQRKGLKKLLEFLEGIPRIIFCGDFNAPRGGEIFGAFARRYKDNIPEKYKTSLDPSHKGYRTWGKELVVEGIFSTPDYDVKNVVLHNGLSDHCAITAEISLAGRTSRKEGDK